MNSDVQALLDALRERAGATPELAGLDLATLARPSVRLSAQRVPYARIGIGDSRIWGVPDVPPGFEWPRWLPARPRDDKFGNRWQPQQPAALGFIAQIDMSAIPQLDETLPSLGWLYFFYDRYCEPWGFDPADRGCCHVAYVDCDRSSLIRPKSPADLEPEHVGYPCLADAWPELTLPDESPDLESSMVLLPIKLTTRSTMTCAGLVD